MPFVQNLKNDTQILWLAQFHWWKLYEAEILYTTFTHTELPMNKFYHPTTVHLQRKLAVSKDWSRHFANTVHSKKTNSSIIHNSWGRMRFAADNLMTLAQVHVMFILLDIAYSIWKPNLTAATFFKYKFICVSQHWDK
jgi:hypothetical protein